MKNSSRLGLLAVLATAVLMQGCVAPGPSPDVYSGWQAQREQTVRMGVIESVRAVVIDNSTHSGAGAVAGGAVGAVAAGSLIGHGSGSVLAALAGGIGGALAGNAIQNNAGLRQGLEITVRLDNGELRAITQEATPEVFRAGDRVRLLSSGGVTRVTH
ncbi:MAG: hypothetical protein ACRYG5_10210 [Janthinobacterium lividum]